MVVVVVVVVCECGEKNKKCKPKNPSIRTFRMSCSCGDHVALLWNASFHSFHPMISGISSVLAHVADAIRNMVAPASEKPIVLSQRVTNQRKCFCTEDNNSRKAQNAEEKSNKIVVFAYQEHRFQSRTTPKYPRTVLDDVRDR